MKRISIGTWAYSIGPYADNPVPWAEVLRKYVNPRLAEIFGYTQQEVLALPSWLELVAPEDRPLVAERVRALVHPGV